jgi:8-oxo-dGTP pyrophosphatase MutT (NUDIX family)
MDYNLRQIFSCRQKKRLTDKKLNAAAVLVPLFNDGKEYRLLLTQRSSNVLQHKGQISFPGGKPQKADSSLLETALRESWEEIGLDPKDVEIVGELDDTPTTTTGFLISPFVALIPYPYKFIRNHLEIADILDIPLSALMDKSCFEKKYVTDDDGKTLAAYSYEYNGRIIWGATANIIKQLLDSLQSASGAQQ